MPLILAIEADRRQTSKIAALAKGQLHAELVTGDTTQHAIEALDGRVPDLILTSLLLSPKDETKLTEWLRELDSAGRHVQTLVIPVLGVPGGSQEEGWLSKRRRGRNKDATPEGCDPAMFAAQISEYLERAAEERRAAGARRKQESKVEKPAVRPEPVRTEEYSFGGGEKIRSWDEPHSVLKAAYEPSFDSDQGKPLDSTEAESFAYEPDPPPAYEVEQKPAYEPEPQPAPEPEPLPGTEPAYEPPPGDILGLRSWDPAPTAEGATEFTDPLLADDIARDAEQEITLTSNADESWEQISVEGAEDAEELQLKAEAIDLDTFVSELRALGGKNKARPAPPPPAAPPPQARQAQAARPAAPIAPPRPAAPVAPPRPAAPIAAPRPAPARPAPPPTRPAAPTRPAPPPVPKRPVAAADADPSVEEFVAALDAMYRIEHVKTTHEDANAESNFLSSPPLRTRPRRRRVVKASSLALPVLKPDTAPAAKPDEPAPEKPPEKTIDKRRPARPAQDEFGMFDPQQCGFAALMAKLDEMSEEEEQEEPKEDRRKSKNNRR